MLFFLKFSPDFVFMAKEVPKDNVYVSKVEAWEGAHNLFSVEALVVTGNDRAKGHTGFADTKRPLLVGVKWDLVVAQLKHDKGLFLEDSTVHVNEEGAVKGGSSALARKPGTPGMRYPYRLLPLC